MNSIIMNINTCEIQKACFLLSDSMLQEMKKNLLQKFQELYQVLSGIIMQMTV